ncbi:DNA phosphorothioation-associated DGQHR protein 1 [Bacteroidales bacterium Barb6]|nr:DNA phosphorothioation-associated DGQHR protein 1 [Bacteroidales bacterium Barb6]
MKQIANMEEIGMKQNNIIKGIPVVQNDQEFIVGKVKIEDLLKFTKYTERVIIGYDENEHPIYNEHIQRKVENSRVNKIADFLINDKEATFPTNIVLGVPLSAIEEQISTEDIIQITLIDEVFTEVEKSKITGDEVDIYVTIIDGQHRIRGIETAIERLNNEIEKLSDEEQKLKKQDVLDNLLGIELVVSYFIDKSLEYQAMIFSTINRTQKRVSQDLVYSLFGLSSNDTPYKTALEVTIALNAHAKSPFYKRIKLYGGNYKRGDSPPLSQATMIKNIVSLISESLRESENDKYKKRKDLHKKNNSKYLPFREYYANNQDDKISDCLFYFFGSVKKNFADYWDYDGVTKPQNILQSTVGFEALLDIMVDILHDSQKINQFDNETFEPVVAKLNTINFADTSIFPMSTKGKKVLYISMSLAIFPTLQGHDNRKEELDYLIREIKE